MRRLALILALLLAWPASGQGPTTRSDTGVTAQGSSETSPDSSTINLRWGTSPCIWLDGQVYDNIAFMVRQKGNRACTVLLPGAFNGVRITKGAVSVLPLSLWKETWDDLQQLDIPNISTEGAGFCTASTSMRLTLTWWRNGLADTTGISLRSYDLDCFDRRAGRIWNLMASLKSWATVTIEVLRSADSAVALATLRHDLERTSAGDRNSPTAKALAHIVESGNGQEAAAMVFRAVVRDTALLYRLGWPQGQGGFRIAAHLMPHVRPILLAGLGDRDRAVRLAAIQSLRAVRDSAVRATATTMLRDRDLYVRSAASFELVEDSTLDAISPLLQAVDHEIGDIEGRIRAVRRLLDLRSPRVRAAVYRHASRAPASFGRALCYADFGKRDTADPTVTAILKRYFGPLHDEGCYLNEIGYRASDTVLVGMLAAAIAASDSLKKAERYFDPLARLGRYARTSVYAILQQTLTRWPDAPRVRVSMAKVETQDALAIIRSITVESPEWNRRVPFTDMGEAGRVLKELLVADDSVFWLALSDSAPGVRLAALRTFSAVRVPGVVSVWRAMVSDPALEVRAAAAPYLLRADRDVALPVVLEAIDSCTGGPEMRQHLLGELLRTKDSLCIDAAVQLGLANPDTFAQPLFSHWVGYYAPFCPRVHDLTVALWNQYHTDRRYLRQVGFDKRDTVFIRRLGRLAETAQGDTLFDIAFQLCEDFGLMLPQRPKEIRSYLETVARRCPQMSDFVKRTLLNAGLWHPASQEKR